MSSSIEHEVKDILEEVKNILLEKNRKYGNSALEPVRIFSKINSIEQLKVRLDDKLSRVRSQQDDEDEDVLMDIMGYVVLLKIALKRKENEKSD